jgi:recombination protein RecT
MQIQSNDQKQTALTVAFDREKAALMESLPGAMDRERWATVALSMLKNPGLSRCTPESVLAAVYKNARVGLPLDGVHASLVPFGQECTHIIGYPGWVSLYSRHAGVTHVRAKVVFDGDRFEVEEGLEPKIVHVPDPKGNHTDPNKVLAAYAVAHLRKGAPTFVVMWKDELESLQTRCLKKTNGKGPWATDPIEMMRKSPIIRLRKGLTLTEDMQAILAEAEREELVVDVAGETVGAQKPLRTADDLKEALAPVESEPEPALIEQGVRFAKGIPISVDWDAVKSVPFGGNNAFLSKMTPADLVALLIAGDANAKESCARLLKTAHEMLAGDQPPPKNYEILALAMEQAELGSAF